MSNGLVIKDAAGVMVFDTTVITYSLLGTLYCAANSTASAVYETNGLSSIVQVFLTDPITITQIPTLATATLTVSGNNTTCSMSGGSVGCTALVYVK